MTIRQSRSRPFVISRLLRLPGSGYARADLLAVSQLSMGEVQAPPWMSHQFIAGRRGDCYMTGNSFRYIPVLICLQMSSKGQARAGQFLLLPPATLCLPRTLPANWESPLADLQSHTKRVIVMTAESYSLSPTRPVLVRAQNARPHLADIIASQGPDCHGNHNLATATWQHPSPQGIDGVCDAVRGGLEGVLLSPSVQKDSQGLSSARL